MKTITMQKQNFLSALHEAIKSAKVREDAAGYTRPSAYRQGLQDVLDAANSVTEEDLSVYLNGR